MRKHVTSCFIALTLALATLSSWAASPVQFTNNSRLSNGKWVKVSVTENGIHQITLDQLHEMGFSDLSRIQIYGLGGHPIKEYFYGVKSDDLSPVPLIKTNDKVLFYARGTYYTNLRDYDKDGFVPYFLRTRNAYSTHGYYFITEEDGSTSIAQQDATQPGTDWVTSCYNIVLHESELASVGYTGKSLLGEEIFPKPHTVQFNLPERSSNNIIVQMLASAKIRNRGGTLAATVIDDDGTRTNVEFIDDECYLPYITDKDVQRHFNSALTNYYVELTHNDPEVDIEFSISTVSGTIQMARLDYAGVIYERNNSYDDQHDYFNMEFGKLSSTAQVVMPGTDNQTVVWDVTDPDNMTQMSLSAAVDNQGNTVGMSFNPGERNEPSKFVVFNPNGEFQTIDSYENVANQNLHGLPTPDMVIITSSAFMDEAERLAQLHRDHDNMSVHVINQEDVFNEFSSGTPDAMAIRLLCKMFYERDKNKFKYLLMFGPASYDFRGLTTDIANRVITYESDESATDQYSYGSDDFFGYMEDGRPSDNSFSHYADKLMLGVGRMTPTNLNQAKQCVDKVIHYVLNPDYSSWRNHYSIWADGSVKGDGTAISGADLHHLQAEGIHNKIQDKLKLPMIADKAYVDMYPTTTRYVSPEAKRHVGEMLDNGQFYGTYVGHAGVKGFANGLWTSTDVTSNSYEHQPIFMTACCDVARFDGNTQGIAELMFLQPDGGAIALLTSSREVEATQNDKLNQAFTEALFSYHTTGQMTTLGEAYMKSKQASTVRYEMGKMSYLLLGDPAVKVNYPKPLFTIKTVNGSPINHGSIFLSPLQEVTVEAEVTMPNSSQVNTSFNGNATLSIYDAQRLLKNATYQGGATTLSGPIYYPRDLLVEVNGRVENGRFVGTAVMPRYIKANPGESLAIHVYAHQENSEDMVNGAFTNVYCAAYDESVAVSDESAPVIDCMYLNDEESFAQEIPVMPNSTLFIQASDDVAFNTQSMAIGSSLKLTLDNKTTYPLFKNYASVSDGGRLLNISFPVRGLSAGKHSLTFYVQDATGKTAERTITFTVGSQKALTIKSDAMAAVADVTIDIEDSSMSTVPALTLKAVDAQGNLVWSQPNVTLPYTWDLTNNDGERITKGLYKLYGQYHDGANYGGTNILSVIVIDPVMTSR